MITADEKMTVVELINEANRIGDMIAALPKGPVNAWGVHSETDEKADMFDELAVPVLNKLHAILCAHFGTEVDHGWSLVDEARRLVEYSA